MKKSRKLEINNPKELENAVKLIQSDIYNISIRKLDYLLSRKLIFWLNTWLNKYLPEEKTFNYNELTRYERGMVVKADLGFKVGSEHGGLHYALIIENDNSISNRTVMAIPLASLELTENPLDIDTKYEIFLGYGIFKEEIIKIEEQIKVNELAINNYKIDNNDYSQIEKTNNKLIAKLNNYKKGSIALLNQMCALSKMRIHFPKYSQDELGNFRLDSAKLNEIDKKIKELYLKKSIIKSGLDKISSIFIK